MSAIVHAQVHAQVHTSNVHVEVRDHRVPDRDDRGHTRPVIVRPTIVRPTIVRPTIVRPIVYTPAPVYTSWTPAPSYTYQPAQPSSIQLLAPTALANDQLSIDVGSLGNATTLELDAAGGSTFVSQVTVISANGAYQVIPVNQMLSAQNPSIPLSIDGCTGVSRIVVDGHSEWGGALTIRAL